MPPGGTLGGLALPLPAGGVRVNDVGGAARQDLVAAVERIRGVALADEADDREEPPGAVVPSMSVSLSMRIVPLSDAVADGDVARVEPPREACRW